MSKMIAITTEGAFLTHDPITAQDYMNMTLMGQLNLFNALVEQGASKAELYDTYNEAASAFLATFAPEIEKRPDLTAEAIMKAENELLAQKANKVAHMTPKQRKIEQLRNDLAASTSPNYIKQQDENLIPLDSLDENGKPKKPVHKAGENNAKEV